MTDLMKLRKGKLNLEVRKNISYTSSINLPREVAEVIIPEFI